MVFASRDGALAFQEPIPGCDAQSVHDLVHSVAGKNLPDLALTSYGEVLAESTPDRRVCRVQATSAQLPGAVWATFTVERHGEDQIFVQVRP
jgi:hypothetical protein